MPGAIKRRDNSAAVCILAAMLEAAHVRLHQPAVRTLVTSRAVSRRWAHAVEGPGSRGYIGLTYRRNE